MFHNSKLSVCSVFTAAVLCLLTGNVLSQTISATTLLAQDCASPSCTVTPTVQSAITIHPSPTVINNAPGALVPLTFTFEPITISQFTPDPTVLSNPGTGTLTLKKTTISNLEKVTVTQSYTVAPTQTLSVAVAVDVQAVAQLFFAENNDPDSVCNLFPDPEMKIKSRITGRTSVAKRKPEFPSISTAARQFADNGIADALTVVNAFLNYFTGVPFNQIPGNIGIFAYLPQTLPAVGNGQSILAFERLFKTVTAIQQFLSPVEQENFEVIFTSLEGAPKKKTRLCKGAVAVTLNKEIQAGCGVDGYTVICPPAVDHLAFRVLPGTPTSPAVGFCQDANLKAMVQARTYDYQLQWGARAEIILHEVTHLERLCAFAGWPMGELNGVTVQTRTNWDEDQQGADNEERYPHDDDDNFDITLLTNIPDARKAVNADNWAFTLMEWYTRNLCKWTEDDMPYPETLPKSP